MTDTRWFTTYTTWGGNNSTHSRCGAMLVKKDHPRLRSRANRKASMKAIVENMPEILNRG